MMILWLELFTWPCGKPWFVIMKQITKANLYLHSCQRIRVDHKACMNTIMNVRSYECTIIISLNNIDSDSPLPYFQPDACTKASSILCKKLHWHVSCTRVTYHFSLVCLQVCVYACVHRVRQHSKWLEYRPGIWMVWGSLGAKCVWLINHTVSHAIFHNTGTPPQLQGSI